MNTDKRFLNYKKYDNFQRDLDNGDIPEDAIVFIQNKRCIWARGSEYAGSLTLNYNEETHTATLKTADGEPIVEFTDKRDYDTFKQYFGRFLEEVYTPFAATTNTTLREHSDDIKQLNTDIRNEITRATGAEESISKTVVSHKAELDATDRNHNTRLINLENRISQEIIDRKTADNKIVNESITEEMRQRETSDTALDNKITVLQQSLDTEKTTRQTDDANLLDRLIGEERRSKAADNNHLARIENLEGFIETDHNGVINKFNEIVAFLNDIEESETLESTLASIIDAIEKTVSKEESRANTTEIGLQNNIDEEVVRAKQAEAELTDKITEEKNRAIDEEVTLRAAVNAEASTRSDKDFEFDQKLNKIINGVKNTINSLYAIINEKYVQRSEVFYPNDQTWMGEKDIINFDPFGILYYVYNTSLFAFGVSDTIGDVFVANNASINDETLCLM